MKEIDGGAYSGSGTIVRQAVALAALTRTDIRITNARSNRPRPGLRPQHTSMVEAIRSLVGGEAIGNEPGSSELSFRPGSDVVRGTYTWGIGSAGSTVLLAQALLPILSLHGHSETVQLRGGVFQDFAPSFYHLRHCLLPLLAKMGLNVDARMLRPGYVPAGEGSIELLVKPLDAPLHSLVLPDRGDIRRFWGISLASHLKERRVAGRMAQASKQLLGLAGLTAEIQEIDDETAAQAGAGFAIFADDSTGLRLGADRAGAPRRRAEVVGEQAARELLEDLQTGANVDRYIADQLVVFAALAAGESRWRPPRITGHVESAAWLVRELLGADVAISDGEVRVRGVAFPPL